MTSKTTTVAFTKNADGAWIGRGGASLCSHDTEEQLTLPEDCEKFFAVFTSRKPAGDDYFELTPFEGVITLDDDALGVAFLADATHLMERLHRSGHRYLHVEVEALPDKVLHFKRAKGWGRWRAGPGGRIGLCATGLQGSVRLPPSCTAFDAVFTEEKPKGAAVFQLGENGLVSTEGEMFYDNAREYLTIAYEEGYRWLQVEI